MQELLPREFLASEPFKEGDVEKALLEAFTETQKKCLEGQEALGFDCSLSGTTATLAFKRRNVVPLGRCWSWGGSEVCGQRGGLELCGGQEEWQVVELGAAHTATPPIR